MMNTDSIVDDYAWHQKASGLREDGIAWRVVLLLRFLDFLRSLDVQALEDVTPRMLLLYQQHVSAMTNRKGLPYSADVRNLHLTVVRKLYELHRTDRRTAQDPTVHLEYAQLPKRLPKAILNEQQIRKLLRQPMKNTPIDVRNRAMLELLYSTGMRKSELVGLDMEDICFDTQTVKVRGKGGKERMVPLGRIASDWLKQYVGAARPALGKRDTSPAVFLNRLGSRLHGQTLKRAIEKRAGAAGLRIQVTPHTFRHSCATHLLDRGADIRHIQEMLGHARLSTTALYTRVSITQLQRIHARYHPREKMA